MNTVKEVIEVAKVLEKLKETYYIKPPATIDGGDVLKIEDNLKGLSGIDRVTSSSSENSGVITVEIAKGENIDFMLLEVKNAVDRVPSFPTGMEPLIVAKREEVRQTISFAVSGKDIPLAVLKQIGRQIENDLRTIVRLCLNTSMAARSVCPHKTIITYE